MNVRFSALSILVECRINRGHYVTPNKTIDIITNSKIILSILKKKLLPLTNYIFEMDAAKKSKMEDDETRGSILLKGKKVCDVAARKNFNIHSQSKLCTL